MSNGSPTQLFERRHRLLEGLDSGVSGLLERGQVAGQSAQVPLVHATVQVQLQQITVVSENQQIALCTKNKLSSKAKREREMFYLTMHSTHFIYGYMAPDIWLRTILIVRKETCCRHIGYSYRLTARVLLYTPSHRQDNTYHGLCYTSCGALAGTRNNSMGCRAKLQPFKFTITINNVDASH